MTKLATVSPVHGLVRTLEPPKGDINGFLRPSMGIIPRGAIMGRRAGSRLLEPVLDSSARSDLEILGCLDMDTIPAFTESGTNGEAVDSDGLPIQVRLRDGALGAFDTGSDADAIDKYDIGLPCFAKNDNTLHLTDGGGTLSFAGIISGVNADGKIEFATDWRIRAMWKFLTVGGESVNLGVSAATELTIASGAIAVTQSNHTIDTEADAASDNLDTITGMVADQLYVLSPASAARTVVLRDFSVGAGNIRTPFGESISLAEDDDYALAISDGTDVTVIAFRTLAANGGGAGALIGLLSALTTTDKASVVAAINEVKANAIAAPAMQVASATLVAGTATVNTVIVVAADSEVIVHPTSTITGSTNYAHCRELLASRVNGIAGVGTLVVEALTNTGVLDNDAAGAVKIIILTPQT